MDTDICPDGDTRTEKEMVVKLIVAHFTAVVAFCNFQSLRNERLDTIEPILFLLSPLILVAQTAIGVIIINVSFISNLAQSPKSISLHLEAYARRWNTLFGKKPSQPRRTPTGSLERSQSRFGSAWIRLGRAVAIFATLFQFAATIFLYRRRKELHGWDALTVVDHRTFELSVGGAVVSTLSLALLLKFPGFGQAPETLYIPGLKPDPAIIFCRGDSRRCPSWYQILYASDIGSATSAATWLACVLSSTYKGESIPLHFLSEFYIGIYTEFARVFSLQISMPIFYLFVAVFFAVFFTLPHVYNGPGFEAVGKSLWATIPALLAVLAAILTFFCPPIYPLGPFLSLLNLIHHFLQSFVTVQVRKMYSSNIFAKAAVLSLLSLSFTTASPCKPQSSQELTTTTPASFTSSILFSSSIIIIPSTTSNILESSTTSDATTSTAESTTEPITTTASTAELSTTAMEATTKPETSTVETSSAKTTTKITGPTCGGPGTPWNTSNFQQVCCNSARFSTPACNLAGGNGFRGVCL
ncbi:hypothetical protein Forpe1208_v011666 [Fusarium oxysporum f. sp. rapae]|uniref:Uncharacterized protein n=1 Tax=Fusarium oxysporum f. sp. rapae TaxID=485398 RepID=A0A8J5TQI0_FUSOX|nr:hypothetical protein Forpe1208_v011666 [Fusarium oxysporum f. sp. rapae]